ncbi:MAG: elongation factor 1-beta [Candidatus Nanoarchaeia archaeon]|nr:elongation factor 1-beta [Candidatus Nanoarchaeia archaeon]MDD5588041.1 elongation factor 1-beta [Candidatus Nanoarchaeia archaeon]
MAKVVITLRIMPESPEVNLEDLEKEAKQIIEGYCSPDKTEFKVSIDPIAFGLKALVIIFVMDEKKGATDPLEEKIRNVPGVESAEITDVRRAIG